MGDINMSSDRNLSDKIANLLLDSAGMARTTAESVSNHYSTPIAMTLMPFYLIGNIGREIYNIPTR
ncbi:MAG: hypothetical protein ACP5D2_02655 [Candidatus Nanoarchaeia archaeon]